MPRSVFNPATVLAAALLGSGCAHHVIHGSVIDRNGEPLERVVVTLQPGNVQLVTNQDGTFSIDYLRDEDGERVKLQRRTEYEVEAFRTGYHIAQTSFDYKRGELFLEPIALKEDTIRVDGSETDIDPDQYRDRSHSSGATYEGE